MPAKKIHIHKRPNSTIWQMWWLDSSGKRNYETTGLPIAEYTREEVSRRMNGGAPSSSRHIHTISWLRDHTLARIRSESYPEKTILQYQRALDILILVRGPDADLGQLRRDVIHDYKTWCLSPRKLKKGQRPIRAAVTINTYLAYLSAAFQYLVRHDQLDRNPFLGFDKIKGRSTRTRELSLPEARHLLTVLDTWPNQPAARLTRMVLYLGLRRNEVLEILPSDVDLKNRRLFAMNEKRADKRKRWIPIPPAILGDLEYFLTTHPTSPRPFFRCHPSTFSHWAKDILAAARLPHFNLYSLRHTFATLAITHGMDIRALQKHMDHSSYSVTENYLHDIPNDDQSPNLGL